MQEMLQEIYVFLEQNGLDTIFISLIISIVGVIITFIKTRTKAIQKKAGYVNINSIKLDDYVILYESKIIPFNSLVIKKKTDLTKFELQKYSYIGGELNVTQKNE